LIWSGCAVRTRRVSVPTSADETLSIRGYGREGVREAWSARASERVSEEAGGWGAYMSTARYVCGRG
jgi:hypothetical protein